jgi:uncharacterized membrane protein
MVTSRRKGDARQEALWQEAEQFTRNGLREIGERMRRQCAEVLALVSKPGVDLRAVLTRMDDVRDAARQRRELGCELWLPVYENLDAT